MPLLLALAAIFLPLLLAWVLLSRPTHSRHDDPPERGTEDRRVRPRD